jgi:hypothetical protein
MSRQRPGSVIGAIWLLIGVVVLSGVTALLTLVLKDELVDAWASDRTDLGSVEPPAFVPVALTMFVVVALLAVVLIVFFGQGHNWARVLLTGLVVLMGVATLASLRTSPPAMFVVLSLLSLVVDVAAVACLWHKDTRAYTDRSWVGSGARS